MNSLKKFVSAIFISLSLSVGVAWAQEQQAPPTSAPAEDQQVQQDQVQQPAPPPSGSAEDQQVQQQSPPPPPGQEAEPRNQQDPPSRVARLQYMSGSVSIQPHGTDEWVGGSLNRPLTNNDNVWTDKDSRAELNVGTGVVRMSSETSLTMTNIGDSAIQVELHQGTVSLRVRHLFEGEIYEVDTPNMAFTVQKTGEYRFAVDPNGDASIVTVWKGEGDATGNGPSVRLKAHQQARFSNGTSLTHEISAAPSFDGFDDWCRVRDQREDHSVSARYVAPGVIGSEDLDAYGSWREVAPYGSVWVPSGVAVGWSPYSQGRWVWISPWGWTWEDDEPWGFAPYHYGRWIYGGGSWGWAPGPYYARPFYAPALVGWFGGPRFGVGFGFGFGGGIGWCPLGWGEPFLPWYGASRGYFERVNIYNTHFNNFGRFSNNWNGGRFTGASFSYTNLRAPGGAIAVPQRTLTNSLSVRGTAVHMPASEFAHASLGGRVGVSPNRTSMLGANAGRAAAGAPSRSFARPVVSRMGASSGASAGARTGANGGFNSAARASQGRAIQPQGNSRTASGSVAARSVPRPPQSGAIGARTSESMNRGAGPGAGTANSARNYVPRPPQGRTTGSSAAEARSEGRSMSSPSAAATNRPATSGSAMNRSVPRPPESGRSMAQGQPRSYSNPSSSTPRGASGGSQSPNRQSQPSAPRFNERSSPGRSSNVPRPTGPVRPAANYQAQGSRYSSGSARDSYSGSRSYGGSAYGSSSSYGGRGYSQPSSRAYSSPSSGGGYSAGSGRGYSAPSGHASAPSSHSSYSGGGRSGGGGGGGGGNRSGGGGHGRGR